MKWVDRRWRANEGNGKSIDRNGSMGQIDLFPDCLFCVRDIYGVDVSRRVATTWT